MRTHLMISMAAVLAMVVGAWAQTPAADAPATTQPAGQPATAPAVTPAARAVLDQVRDAYANLTSLDVAGTMQLDLDAAGQKQNKTADFTGSFAAPDKFRHEMKGDLLIVGNGEKAYVYKTDAKRYITMDAPRQRVAVEDLPEPLSQELGRQNPSLLYALSTNAQTWMVRDAQALKRGADVVIDGVAYPSLAVRAEQQQLTIVVNPQTHLIRQLLVDLKDHLKARGVPMVNQALVTIDYSQSRTGGTIAAGAYNWVPPADATLVKPRAEESAAAEDAGPASALVGQPAPGFTLKDMEGHPQSLSSFKGRVVVLDFWATWCPPCREELPHLEKISKDLAGQSVDVIAVNRQESREVVSKFLQSNQITLRVLLDEDGGVSDQYKAQAIPQTVVIGKDGKIISVFVGFGPDREEQIRQAIQGAITQP